MKQLLLVLLALGSIYAFGAEQVRILKVSGGGCLQNTSIGINLNGDIYGSDEVTTQDILERNNLGFLVCTRENKRGVCKDSESRSFSIKSSGVCQNLQKNSNFYNSKDKMLLTLDEDGNVENYFFKKR
jgi:hypothetical protein